MRCEKGGCELTYFSENSTNPNRALQMFLLLAGAARERKTLTYIQIAHAIGYKGAGVLGRPLGHIAYWCLENGLPPLTVLAVNEKTGLPGDEYIGPGDLHADRERVFAFDWVDLIPPTAEELKAAFDRAG